ncbi:MAG TPA: preprotein translocase subunit SecG [Candidatus Acidoferrum sp.]|jgi:preprotein translocase subunit SecG|nr:preprotein translocase subunit SecG [Candidatus Acidoferrum sp.]
MAFIIGILTFIMVLDCLVLVLLVLIQLPKKEAGAGLAFGGGASDALFGAGSGTVLTKITRWAATGFFILAVGLAILQKNFSNRSTSKFEQQLGQPGRPPVTAMPATPSAPATQPTAPLSSSPAPLTSSDVLLTPQPEATAVPAVPPPAAPTTNTALPK